MLVYTLTLLTMVGTAAGATCNKIPGEIVAAYGSVANNLEFHELNMRLSMPSVDWTLLLEPAPAAVALLSKLILITANSDIQLNTTMRKFTYLKSHSLRNVTLQLVDIAYAVFSNATERMDQISMYSKFVEESFNPIMRKLYLLAGMHNESSEFMEHQQKQVIENLISIQKAANKSSQLIMEICNDFDHVLNVVQELLRVAITVKDQKRSQLEIIKVTLEKYKLMEKKSQEEKTRLASLHDEFQKKLNDEIENLSRVRADKPGFWRRMIGVIMDLFALINHLSSTFRNISRIGKFEALVNPADPHKEEREHTAALLEAFNLLKTEFDQTLSGGYIMTVQFLADNVNMQIELPATVNESKVCIDRAAKLKPVVNHDKLQKMFTPTFLERITNMCDMANTLCTQLEEQASNRKQYGRSQIQKTMKLADEYSEVAIELDYAVNDAVQSLGLPAASADDVEKAKIIHFNNIYTFQSIMASYELKVLQQKQKVQYARHLYTSSKMQQERNRQDLMQITDRINLVESHDKDMGEEFQVVIEAVNVIGDLTTRWMTVSRFMMGFQISVNNQWGVGLNRFVSQAKTTAGIFRNMTDQVNAEEYRHEAYNVLGKILTESLFHVASHTERINEIATSYTTFSKKHILGPLTDMAGLVNFTGEPTSDKNLQESITTELRGANADIDKIIKDHETAFNEALDNYEQRLTDAVVDMCDDAALIRKVSGAVEKAQQTVLKKYDFSG